jgi:hypothetical protein
MRHLLSLRFGLSLGAALAVAVMLVTQRGQPVSNIEGPGIVYVYFPSLCALPGDARDCHEIPGTTRPAFDSMEACSAFADVRLREERNPRLLASCLKQREV